MKAVFLDRNTFSPSIELAMPDGITDWVVHEQTAAAQIFERVQDADIILTNKVILDADLLARLPHLKMVQITATGTNNIDQAAADKLGIAVKNVAGYSVESVAEHVFMLMLAAMRGLKPYHQAVEDGSWKDDGRFCLTEPAVLDLHDKTLGIIGVGDIGRALTMRAEAFGIRVLWAERQGKAPRDENYTTFDEVLAQSDIISLNCPLTDETHHLINAETIAKMAKKPLLINGARGPVVEPLAVSEAVKNGGLLGFASDVFEQEPPATDDPLLTIAHHPRVIYSPHIAWASEFAQRKLWRILCAQVTDFINIIS